MVTMTTVKKAMGAEDLLRFFYFFKSFRQKCYLQENETLQINIKAKIVTSDTKSQSHEAKK